MALAIIFLYFFPQKASVSNDADNLIKAKTIAVLPFKNLSDDPETQYFVDGIMDVILSNLARISDLQVTSRTSVEQYRERQIPVKEIAKELNVNYLLEASVQRVGDRMKIVVQLIDAAEDKHLWAEDYDREWTDILELESELSLQIAEQLHARIGNREIRMIETVHQTDPIAHDFVLKGDSYFTSALGRIQEMDFAKQMYQNALDIDPNYALAWFKLGQVERNYYHFYHIRNKEQIKKIKDAFDRASELNPNLLESRLGLATYYYSCEHDYEKAIEIINDLILDYPNNGWLKSWLALNYRRMNNLEKTNEYYEKAIALEPTGWNHWYGYAQNLRNAGKFRDSEAAFKRARILNPSSISVVVNLGGLYQSVGELEKAGEMFADQLVKSLWAYRSFHEEYLRNYRQALKYYRNVDLLSDQGIYRPKPLGLGLIYHLMGSDSARFFFEQSIKPLEEKLETAPEDDRVLISLGLTYAGLGEKEKALNYGEEAIKIMNPSIDANGGRNTEFGLMRIYIMTGEFDKALDIIRDRLTPIGYFTIPSKQHPIFDPLRDLPEFQAILEDPKYQINWDKEEP